MTGKDKIEILKENIEQLQSSLIWLNRSYIICKDSFDSINPSAESMDAMESLTSRFSRTVDILSNKVIRSIVYIEHGEVLTWIDSLIFLEKIGLIKSIDQLRLLKELRNDIVHEYGIDELIELFKEVINQTGSLLELSSQIINYSEKLIAKVR